MSVGNDEVRNDPVSMFAGTFHTKDPDMTEDDLIIDSINKTSAVISETTALTYGSTGRTSLQLGLEFLHEFRKKLIRSKIWNN